MVQNVCEHHEWIEATQTTTGGNNFTFTQCNKCGKVQSLMSKNELPITTKEQAETFMTLLNALPKVKTNAEK